MLHVLNGDATKWKLELAGVPGELTVYADVLHEGPTPGGVTREEFRRVRAAYLDGRFGESDALPTLTAWDDGLDRWREHDEVVFWFEHDLFDQLLLIRHLHWRSTLEPGRTRFTEIVVGEFPGIERFTGLGALSPDQLVSLFPSRTPVTGEQVEAGRETWELFCSPDPMPLQERLAASPPSLPFLEGALRRHFEEYPAVGTGLSRTERQILTVLSDGPRGPSDLFRALQAMEERVYMGDASFWGILTDMARAGHPLVTLDQQPRKMQPSGGRAAITPFGADVLAGLADHVAVNGIDKWLGGVHLTDGLLRWNNDNNRLQIAD